MAPEEIAKTYEVLANVPQAEALATAGQIAERQQNVGTLAAAVGQGTPATGGLGTYTYNRLYRPQVESMRDSIISQGLTEALNAKLQDMLNQANLANQRAQRSYTGGGGGGGSTTPSGDDGGATFGGTIDAGEGTNVMSTPTVMPSVSDGATGQVETWSYVHNGVPYTRVDNNTDKKITYHNVEIDPGKSHIFKHEG